MLVLIVLPEESFYSSAKNPDSINTIIKEIGPHNEAKEFDQNKSLNLAGPSFTAEVSSITKRNIKKADADILAKENDSYSLKSRCNGF